MPGYYYNTQMFDEGFSIAPRKAGGREFYGDNSTALVTGNDFTITSTAATIVNDNVGGRPAWNITNSGSTATDILQGQGVAASILAQQGKALRMKGSFYMSTITQEFSFGFYAMDTSIIASESTDFLKIEKLTGSTGITVGARKASGTHEQAVMPIVLSAATWYDWEVIYTLDPSIVGRGRFQFILGVSLPGGGAMTTGQYNGIIQAQFPDTVKLAPAFAWRAGSPANVSGYMGHFGWLLER